MIEIVDPKPKEAFCPHRALCFIIWGVLVTLASIWGGCYLIYISPEWLNVPLIMTSAAASLGGLVLTLHGIFERSVK